MPVQRFTAPIETAKANGLIPFDYLMYVLAELPREPESIDPLMPWNFQKK